MPTIQKRGDGYRITVSCGYDLTGKQIRRTTTWKPEPGMTARQIEKELARQAVLFEERCKTGQVLDGGVKFADFAEQWFEDYGKTRLRPTTYRRYRSLLPRVNAAIGHIRLDRLQPHHLIALYKNLQESGIRTDVKYRPAQDVQAIMHARSLTQDKLAKMAGVAITVVRAACHGKNVAEQSARKLSAALELPALFEPVDQGKTLSTESVRYHHRMISSILSTAVKWQVIPTNPCERVDLPKAERKEAHYLDEEQAGRLLEALDREADIQYRTAVQVLLYTGLRRGELCGLEWQDVDFDQAVLHVCRSSIYLPGRGVFTDETKTHTSVRSIKVSADVLTLLRAFRVWQNQHRLQLGDQWHECGRLFTTWDGQPIHPDTLSGWFHDFIQRNDLPPITLHGLRHTNATLLIAAGTNLQTVAKRLGHANTTTTSKIYAHAIQSADAAAADTLQDILHPVRKQA